ncbi:MAG: PLP-dependent transferase, partial [Pseudonocardiaceae bacterium]
RLVHVATSLGSVHSKVSHAASTTHRQLDDTALEAAGIGPGQVRLSVGVEDPRELFTDLRQALETA